MPAGSAGFALSARAARAAPQPISELIALAVQNPELISLAAGLVDYQTLPVADAARLAQEVLRPARGRAAAAALQYGTTAGYPPLRDALLERLARLDGLPPRQLAASPDDLVVTSGSQQVLFLLTEVLVDPGDIVLTGWPDYFVYAGVLSWFGAEVRAVDMDQQGLIPEALDDVLRGLAREGRLARVKIVYICSYHQNPTGLTLAEERRPRVLEIVRRYSTGHRILVLEDAAYRELTYEGRPPRSLRSFDPRGDLVALAGTFSKPFAPGVKTGYVLLPRDLAAPVLLAKGNQDFGSANLCQHLLHAALSSGVYDRHVQALCQAYRAKRDALLESLDRCLGDLRGSGAAGWTRPGGGLYVYLTLPPDVDASRTGPLFARALEAGVLYVPGEYCHPADPTRRVPRNTLRLSFGVPTVDQIRSGVERLGHAIRAAPRSVAAR